MPVGSVLSLLGTQESVFANRPLCFHELLPPVVEPVALLHQRETCTSSPISLPLTGSAGTRRKSLKSPSGVNYTRMEYGGLTVRVVVERLEEGHGSYTGKRRNRPCKLKLEAKVQISLAGLVLVAQIASVLLWKQDNSEFLNN